MSEGNRCKDCGTAIPADSPGGFCAQCLLGLGLGEEQRSEGGGQKSDIRDQSSDGISQTLEVRSRAALTEKAGDRIGRYRLLQEIGHGGCGVVYMAEQEEPVRRRVALKVIKLGMDTRQVVARFEAERQALALMDHPNIAKVLDAGATDTGRPYFVMELVGGIRITDYCDRNHLTTRQQLDLFIQVCRAIQHAHQKGIIHRDIKPSNVLVATQDGTAVPKVIDFGIAKATQGKLTDQTLFTAFEQFIGTPAYMSPEQAQLGGLDIDTRSDIYSLGVLLYELLTGTTPFDTRALVAAGLDEMRRTIREVEPVKPSTRLKQECLISQQREGEPEEGGGVAPKSSPSALNSQLSTDLDWIVMKCLEKDRARRYETANGLASDIERHLSNEPVLARPPSRLYEFQKSVRRHKFGFGATAAVIAALSCGIVATSFQALRARRAEREQSRLRQEAQAARQDATEKLWASYLAEARALRMSGQAGRQFDSLAALQKAAAIRPTLALRNEAIASMVLPDIRGRGEKNFAEERGRVTVDPRCENYAVCDRAGIVRICRTSDDRELSRLPSIAPAAILPNAFSSDGKWLVVTYADERARVWDWAAPALALDVPKCKMGDLQLAPDSPRLAISDCTNIVLYDLASRKKVHTILLTGLGGTPQKPGGFTFDASGRRLAMRDVETGTNVFVVDTESGIILQNLPHPETTFGLAWHPDGRRLATASADSFIRIWDTATGERLRSFQVEQVVSVAFNHEGNLLASSGWDGKTRLFEFPSGRPQASIYKSGNILGFSPGDRTLAILSWDANQLFLFEIASCRGFRTVRERLEGSSGPGGNAIFDPRGRFLAYQAAEGVRLWDSLNRQEAGVLPGVEQAPCGFDAAGENLLICGPQGLLRCPIRGDPGQGMIEFGATTPVQALTRPIGVISADGTLCALAGTGENRWRILRTDTLSEVARTGVQPGTDFAAFSQDGKLLAGGAARFPGVKVWNAQTGELLKDLPVNGNVQEDSARVAFSPGGQLVTSTWQEYCFWDVARWSVVRRIPQQPGNDFPAKMAFTPDGRIFAGIHSRNVVRLYDAATGQVLADLEAPNSKFITALAFNGDGTQLVACESRDALRVWDLREIREKLAELGLDWGQPPATESAKAVQAERAASR